MKKRFLFLLLILLVSVEANSILRLNVETILRNHIDEGLLLSSEFNFSEFVHIEKEFSKKIGEKIEIRLNASFSENLLVIGPTDIVKIEGEIVYKDFDIGQKFKLPKMLISLGQKKAVNIEIGTERWLEILISPQMESYYVP